MLFRSVLVLIVIGFADSGFSNFQNNNIAVLKLPKCRYNTELCSETFKAFKSNQLRAVKYPCECFDGQCSCCTGRVLQNFNINMRQRLCLNMTYDSEETAVGMKVSFNDQILYRSSLSGTSGKNPPPLCIPVPRFSSIRFCIRLTNVYFMERNFHACVNVESQWNKETSFSYQFDCLRVGMNGVAIVSPEEGGGLAEPIPTDEDVIEEYDELLQNQPTKKPTGNRKKNKTRRSTTPRTGIPIQLR